MIDHASPGYKSYLTTKATVISSGTYKDLDLVGSNAGLADLPIAVVFYVTAQH